MIAVIPVGSRRPASLPYVLRSLRLYADVTEVVTVGDRPHGIEPDLHIDSPNAGKPHLNIAGHLRKIDLAEFVWCDDDTFTVRPWVPGVYTREYSIAQMLRLYPTSGNWSGALRSSISVMEAWGFDPETVPAGTVHRPWLVTAERAGLVLDALDSAGGGSFKALYPAGIDVIAAADPKINGRGLPRPDADVISVDPHAWGKNAGRIIRERFTEPTRWETEPPIEPALRGPRRVRATR